MFLSPFPSYISFFCGDITATKKKTILSQEEKILDKISSKKRQDEFILGRSVAHLALKKFGLDSVPILRNQKTREPCWPKSIFGSITHSGCLAAAAVGLNADITGIGIDLENLSNKLDLNVQRHICVEEELEWLKKLNPKEANLHLRIIFSAKESIFKCFFPASRTYLHFKDACIKLNEKNSEFSYILSKACSKISDVGFKHRGLFSIKKNFLLTSTFIKKYN